MILFQFIQCIFVSSLMKLSPNEIIQGEGVTQTKKNTLASAGKTEPGSSWRKLSYRTGMGKS